MADPDERFRRERHHVGPGWQPILEEAHAALKELDPEYQVLQIKEKFGELRYYVAASKPLEQGGTAPYTAITSKAEMKSITVCEECGGEGRTLPIGGWYRTLCPRDAEIARKRREQQVKEMQEERAKTRLARETPRQNRGGQYPASGSPGSGQGSQGSPS